MVVMFAILDFFNTSTTQVVRVFYLNQNKRALFCKALLNMDQKYFSSLLIIHEKCQKNYIQWGSKV